jgi:hypothetical protein
MEIWTAFLLGLVGSVHCAGMCGPIALALPVTGRTRAAILSSRLAYNLGRIATYVMLGVLFGLVGRTVALAGFQRWLSLTAGGLILVALVASSRFAPGIPAVFAVTRLKRAMGGLLRQRSLTSLLALGSLNGLLPCGLVYAACAGAAATGDPLKGVQVMLAFGLGTLPVMLSLALAGQRIQAALRFRLNRLMPSSLAIVGTLLILRGLALGIPYLSPDLAAGCAACH